MRTKSSSIEETGTVRFGGWTTLWSVLLALATAVLLASCGESETADTDTRAYDYGGYNEWDADNNDELDENEFEDSVADTGIYEEWDTDSNDVIDENEFSEQTS